MDHKRDDAACDRIINVAVELIMKLGSLAHTFLAIIKQLDE